MLDPQIDNNTIDTISPRKEDLVDENVNNESSSFKVMKLAGSAVYSIVKSQLGRRVILSTVLYCAGSTLVSTVGLVPLVVTSMAVSLL